MEFSRKEIHKVQSLIRQFKGIQITETKSSSIVEKSHSQICSHSFRLSVRTFLPVARQDNKNFGLLHFTIDLFQCTIHNIPSNLYSHSMNSKLSTLDGRDLMCRSRVEPLQTYLACYHQAVAIPKMLPSYFLKSHLSITRTISKVQFPHIPGRCHRHISAVFLAANILH